MSAPFCRKCGRPLGDHHTPECIWEHTVVPSECDGIIEEAIATVKARGSADAKREAEAIARLRKLVDESLDGSPVSEQMLSNGPVAEMLADLRALLDAHATLKTAHTKALGVVLSLEFGGRDQKCPVCVGWDMSPRGETPLKHTADCALAAVLAKAGRR